MARGTIWITLGGLAATLFAGGLRADDAAAGSSSEAKAAVRAVIQQAMSARVDALLAAKWADAGVTPAPLCDDAEFLRRASLDLTGIIPAVSEVRSFLADSRPDKRARWIDMLLAKPSHATHLANTWRAVMIRDGGNVQQFGGYFGFQNWLRGKFADNVPYDQVVSELLTATGQVNQNGPVLFYTALDLKPEELAASTARIFLGVKIECAQCHNHPFDHWTQTDFWGYAAFFARLQQPQPQQPIAFQVADADAGEVKLPRTDAVVPPKYLAGATAADEPGRTRRAKLAAWLTSAENPYFARATVNRVWAHLFGRGLVNPVDDLGAHNPASHPELLDELAVYFAETGFDLRQLFRTLANTRAYQLSSAAAGDGEEQQELFARMTVKSLSAEQLYDCLAEAMRRREGPQQQYGQFVVSAGAFDANRQAFVAKFQAPTQGAAEFQAGIPQALTLMNGQVIAEATDLARSDLLAAVDAPFFTPEEQVDVLFLSTLSRLPRDEERQQFIGYVASGATTAGGNPAARRKALGDVLWAILNSAEFVLNH